MKLQLLGALLIVNSLTFAIYFSVAEIARKGPAYTSCGLGVLVGLVLLTASDRWTKVSVWGATIEAAAKQATTDSIEVAEIRKRVEAQATNVELVAQAAKEAKVLSAEAKTSIEDAKKNLKEIDSKLSAELAKLQSRNRITALADDAISNCSVESYRELERLGGAQSVPGPESEAARSELSRIFGVFSAFGPTRIAHLELNVGVINPLRKNEDELTAEDVLTWLEKDQNGFGRAKLAEVLGKRAKKGSFKTADAIARAVAKETNLEAIRYLRGAFIVVAGYDKGGRLDGQDLVEWWEKNKAEFKSKETDPH